MTKFLRNLLSICSFLLIGLVTACSNPDDDIKELNEDQLIDVIDTVFVNKDVINDNAKQDAATDVNALTDNSKNNNTDIPADALVNNELTKINSSAEPSLEAQTAEDTALSDLLVDSTLTETNEQELDQEETAGDSVSNAAEAEKIANTNFSDPITESQIPADAILNKILADNPAINYAQTTVTENQASVIEDFCQKVSNRLKSVSLKLCRDANHRISPFNTVNDLPIVITEFPPTTERKPLGKILVIGGTHGDELTSVSTAYKWIDNLNKFHTGLFHWHIAPAINADAILARPATRQNANGVDLNRNLPTPDWEKQSNIRWEKLSQDPRKAPGKKPASEPETQWIMHEIATFQPDAIVSIHAPYGLLDFDAPKLNTAPQNFGRLQLNLLGTYPGSLGNYAGIQQQIPVLTLELPNASAMPSQKELSAIWSDMIRWLQNQLNSN